MKRIGLAALAALLGFAGVCEANAFTGSGRLTTRRSTYYASASGGGSEGTCSRAVSDTGARRCSYTRNGQHQPARSPHL